MSQPASLAIGAFFDALGHPAEGELASTPERVESAWRDELLAGYRMDAHEILSERCETGTDSLVVMRDLAAVVICPHHLLPSTGFAHIGYEPTDACVGLGALARLVDCFGRRLALQEDVSSQIARALVDELGARGAICTLDLSPTCMVVRGERQANARALTTAEAGTVSERLRFAFQAGSR